MSAPPTTRASRSRYASPAVGAGARNTKDCNSKERDKGPGKAKDRDKDNTARPARSSSMERSRRFMESWIEPERARLTSFQEDGLIRQGVLETMEPLGTRPKPAMIKKLVGIGREASPTPSARGKLPGKKILVKRKTGNGAVSMSSGRRTPGAASAVPEPLSGTQSPTPAPSTTVATPRTATSPITTPTMANPPQTSPGQVPSATPNAPIVPLPLPEFASEQKSSSKGASEPTTYDKGRSRRHPPESPSATRLPTSSILSLPPVALSTSSLADPFLPDPVKQSIEEPPSLHNLPTTPRSIASTYDTDEYCRRESSLQSISQLNMPSKHVAVDDDEAEKLSTTPAPDTDGDQDKTATADVIAQPAQRRTGPIYIASELARIVEHKEVVKTAIDKGVEEALRHFQYVDAWALQFMYDDKEEDARFLLLTEAVFTQTATAQAVGEWARELHAFKILGSKGNAALRHFVPEARADESYEPTQALPAEYGDLITMDMSEVRDPNNYKEELQLEVDKTEQTEAAMVRMRGSVRPPEGGVSRVQAEAEAEDERVATPPRKRQKTSGRDSPMARKASNSARAGAMKSHGTVNNGGNMAESPLRHHRQQRLPSEDSDLSTLSSLGSLSPTPEPASWARPVTKASQEASSTAASVAVDMTDDDVPMHELSGAAEGVAEAAVTNGTSKAAPDEAAARAQPIAGGRRRAPARARRGGPNNLAPEPGPVPRPSPGGGGPNFTSNSKANPNSNLDSRNPSPDSHHSANYDVSAPTNSLINTNALAAQSNQPSKRSKRGMPNFDPQYCLDQGDEGTVRRRMARNTTIRLTQEARIKGDSFARSKPVDAPSPPERPSSSQSSLSSLSALDEGGFEEPTPEAVVPTPRVASSNARATRSTKRTHDDVEDEATPFSLDFPVEAGLGAVTTSSRAGTPRPNKKQRTGGRRLKLSPMKNKAAPSAGVPRGGNRASPSANGALANQEENDDFCSSCGGNGSLVCCDGCTRAFHELCHDPIVDPNDDSEWFCHDCTIKRDPGRIGEYSGPFGELMTNLDKKGATSYRLPKRIREYFEGVRTGVDGEFEDYIPPAKGKKRKEEPKPQEEDLYAIVDKDNRPIFCHSCQRSAASNRPMMPCSICGLYWHMDCLDPPRPHLPNPRTFVCPCHIDDLLLRVPAQMGPAHKFRKIKGSSEIVYAYRRGNVNNGWIEIDDDESEGDARLNFRDPDSYGRTYRVRSSGLKEDFVSKFGAATRARELRSSDQSQPPALYHREDAEEIYEAARNMMAFRRGAPDSGCQHPVHTISDMRIAAAKRDELKEMQAEVARLHAKIEAQLQKALGRQPAYEQSLGTNGTSLEETQPSAQNGVGLLVQSSAKEADDKTTYALLPRGGKETKDVKPTTETVAELSSSVVKAEQSPDPHIALESALTPVSDLVKDGDVALPLTVSGTNDDGIGTPATSISDQKTSPADAGDLSLD